LTCPRNREKEVLRKMGPILVVYQLMEMSHQEWFVVPMDNFGQLGSSALAILIDLLQVKIGSQNLFFFSQNIYIIYNCTIVYK